tara:strand:+ start:1537 stop:2874 length:1338 start_codon:yes stop_codon:yes gene_type:complete
MSARDERVLTTVFLAVGVGALFPWNVFITERPYFARRFASMSVVDNFEGAFAFAYSASNLLGVVACARTGAAERLGNLGRLTTPLAATALAIWTCALVTRATSWSAEEVYGQTMAVIVVVGACTALAQSGGFAAASRLPPRFARAAMSGQALSGVAASLSALITTASAGGDTTRSVETQAEVYFYVAAIVVAACAGGTAWLERSTAYKKYIDEAREEERRERARAETSSLLGGESEDEETAFNDYTNYDDDGLIVDGRADANGLDADGAPSRVVVDDSREYRLAVAVTFIATLSVFPAVTSSIESTTNALGALWSPTLFLLFNLGDLLGRHAAATFPETPSGASLLHLALLRFAFIPLIAACNVTTPTWIVPVVFNHDVFAVVFILALAVTNGLLATVAVSHGARRVPPTRRQSEGVALTTALIAGIFFGSLLSLGVVFLFSGAR